MIENKPAITVIICMYKGEATVKRMIDCVLNQTFRDFELILVDDGSPDKCGDIADEYAQKDERVRVLHKPNGGLADARNKALEIAKGEYTIQFDQDDWVELNCLEEMYAEAKKQDADMLICDYYHNDQYRQSYAKQTPTALDHWSVLEDVVKGKLFGYCWNKLVKLDVYHIYDVKFPTIIYGCEDQYGMCQILKHDIRIAYLPNAFCHYVYGQESLSRYYDDKTLTNDILVRDIFVDLLKNTNIRELTYRSKTVSIVNRAFMYGDKVFSSESYCALFDKDKKIVLENSTGYMKFFHYLAFSGMYQFSRRLFGILFSLKQFYKKKFSYI